MSALPPEHERMLAEAAIDDAQRRARGLRRVISLVSGAGTFGAAYVGAADMGDYQVFSEVAMAGALSLISQASEDLQAAEKEPDYDKNGAALVQTIAMRGGSKGKALRSIWKQLLKNAIDPTYEQEIRIEDIALMDTLNPSDCLILLAISTYRDLIQKEYATQNIHNALKDRIPESVIHQDYKSRLLKNGMSLKDISKMCSTVIGSKILVPESELEWSILSRSTHEMTGLSAFKNGSKEPLFDLEIIVKNEYLYVSGTNSTNLHQTGCGDLLNGSVVLTALPSSLRLASILKI